MVFYKNPKQNPLEELKQNQDKLWFLQHKLLFLLTLHHLLHYRQHKRIKTSKQTKIKSIQFKNPSVFEMELYLFLCMSNFFSLCILFFFDKCKSLFLGCIFDVLRYKLMNIVVSLCDPTNFKLILSLLHVLVCQVQTEKNQK